MAFWLLKNELADYSIDDMARDKRTEWSGVRNYQARNFMRDQMKKGDLAFFYQSNAEPSGCVGVVRICSESHSDTTQFDPKSKYYEPKANEQKPIWFCVDVEFVEKFPKVISIASLRENSKLKGLEILRPGSRLSVTPVLRLHFDEILKMSKK